MQDQRWNLNKNSLDYVDKGWHFLFYNPLQKVEENKAMCGHTQLIRNGGGIVWIIQTPSKAHGNEQKVISYGCNLQKREMENING